MIQNSQNYRPGSVLSNRFGEEGGTTTVTHSSGNVGGFPAFAPFPAIPPLPSFGFPGFGPGFGSGISSGFSSGGVVTSSSTGGNGGGVSTIQTVSSGS